jgi:hypothetical protein
MKHNKKALCRLSLNDFAHSKVPLHGNGILQAIVKVATVIFPWVFFTHAFTVVC